MSTSIIRDFTQGNITRHLYRMALPIMGTAFVQMAYNFTDIAWLGRLSAEAVAAVGTISVFLWIAYSVGGLTKTASEVIIAQFVGRSDLKGARAYASQIMMLSLLLSLLVIALYSSLGEILVGIYRLEPEVHAQAMGYFHITLVGLPAVFMGSTLSGIYNAIGQSKVPFYMLFWGLVCNMLLDPLFIHILGWGVWGAGFATILSQIFVFLLFLRRLYTRDRLLDSFPFFTKINLGYWWQILKVGIPASLLNILFALVSIYMGRLVTSTGGAIGIAVLTTGAQLEALTWSTAQGATTALTTITAQNYAAGAFDRVRLAYHRTLAFTMSVGFVGMIFFILAGEWFFSVIVPDQATFTEGGIYMRIAGYSQIFMMLELTTQGLFYGMGRTTLPAGISIGGNYLRIPLALYFLSLGWGLEAIWWAISISSIIKGIVALAVYLSLRRRLLKTT